MQKILRKRQKNIPEIKHLRLKKYWTEIYLSL